MTGPHANPRTIQIQGICPALDGKSQLSAGELANGTV